MGVTYRILASASASASASGQAGLGVQPQTTPPPLTTIFTPPPECKTPFVYEADCHSAYGCDGYYLPVLRVGNLNGPPIKCYPETTTLSDGVVDAIYDYNPGLFCPDGMTTATRIGTVFLCCPTGLTYTYDGRYDFCSATWTEWTGYAGSWKDLEGAISKTVVFSAADHMRLNVAAPVIWLSGQDPDANPGNGLGSPSRLSPSTPPGSGPPTTADSNTTETSTLLKASSNPPNNNNNNNNNDNGNNNNNNNNGGNGNVNNNNNNNCRRDDCQITTTALSGTREESTSPTKQSEQDDLNRSGAGDSVPLGSVGAQIGLGVGGAFVLILLTLGFILLRRYRRKRLLKRTQGLNSPATESDESGAEVARQLGGYTKKYVPELPVVESRVELEGTLADDRGAGIYVWKPELEGTAGARGARDVYVKKKSELEARRGAAANSERRAGARLTPGSPTDESSFTRPRDPPPTPSTIQAYI